MSDTHRLIFFVSNNFFNSYYIINRRDVFFQSKTESTSNTVPLVDSLLLFEKPRQKCYTFATGGERTCEN